MSKKFDELCDYLNKQWNDLPKYPRDFTPIGGPLNPRWKEWIKEHPDWDKDD